MNRLAELMAEHSRKRGRRLTQAELSKETGISQATISSYVTNSVTRYDSDTVSRFLQFFDVGIDEFFVVEEAPQEDEQGQTAGLLKASA